MDFIFNLLNEIHMDMEQEKSTSSRKGDCHNANLYTYISNPGSLRIRVLHFYRQTGRVMFKVFRDVYKCDVFFDVWVKG